MGQIVQINFVFRGRCSCRSTVDFIGHLIFLMRVLLLLPVEATLIVVSSHLLVRLRVLEADVHLTGHHAEGVLLLQLLLEVSTLVELVWHLACIADTILGNVVKTRVACLRLERATPWHLLLMLGFGLAELLRLLLRLLGELV